MPDDPDAGAPQDAGAPAGAPQDASAPQDGGAAPAEGSSADAGTGTFTNTDGGAALPAAVASSSGSGSGAGSGSGSGCGCTFCNADSQTALARGGQSTNGSGSPSLSPCLGQGPPQHGSFPSIRPLTMTEQIFLAAVMAGAQALPGGTLVSILAAAGALAHANGCTVALGLGGDAIGIGGASVGGGIYYGPNGEIGVYGGVGLDAGFALGVSGEIVYTIIAGAPNVNFVGDCWVVTLSGGEVVVVGGAAIFAYTDGHFVGVSVSAGVGAGAPIALYGQLSHTWISGS
jgi:hypothetical protein